MGSACLNNVFLNRFLASFIWLFYNQVSKLSPEVKRNKTANTSSYYILAFSSFVSSYLQPPCASTTPEARNNSEPQNKDCVHIFGTDRQTSTTNAESSKWCENNKPEWSLWQVRRVSRVVAEGRQGWLLGFPGMNLVHSGNRNRTGYGPRGVRREAARAERYAGARLSGHERVWIFILSTKEINGGFETNNFH